MASMASMARTNCVNRAGDDCGAGEPRGFRAKDAMDAKAGGNRGAHGV